MAGSRFGRRGRRMRWVPSATAATRKSVASRVYNGLATFGRGVVTRRSSTAELYSRPRLGAFFLVLAAVATSMALPSFATADAPTCNTAPPYPNPNGPAPTISGVAQVGNALSVSSGNWNSCPGAGPPIVQYFYQWLRNGIGIFGAVSNTYTTTQADANQELRVQVKASNSEGVSDPWDSNTVTVTPNPPPPPPPPPPPSGFYSSLVLADSPVAYWKLDESAGQTIAADSSSNGNDAQVFSVGFAAEGALREQPDAGGMFGGNAGLVVADTSRLNAGTLTFTVELWLRTTSVGTTIINKAEGAALHETSCPQGSDPPCDPVPSFESGCAPYPVELRSGWAVSVSGDAGKRGLIKAQIASESGALTCNGVVAYGSSRVNDGDWHHVAVVFDRGAGITIYVDTAPAFTAGVFASDVSNTKPLRVGATYDRTVSETNYVGDLDEVALYSHALTQAQVSNHVVAARPIGDKWLYPAGDPIPVVSLAPSAGALADPRSTAAWAPVLDPTPSVGSPSAATPVNRSLVVQYAETHVGRLNSNTPIGQNGNDWNTSYPEYADDCTNLVSQALRAGGWTLIEPSGAQTASSAGVWFINSRFDYSYSWSVAEYLKQFIVASGRGMMLTSYGQLQPGDLIFTDFGRPGAPHHVEVVSRVTVQDNPPQLDVAVDQHTTNRLQYSFRTQLALSPPATMVWLVHIFDRY
jgi:hypothetical protein